MRIIFESGANHKSEVRSPKSEVWRMNRLSESLMGRVIGPDEPTSPYYYGALLVLDQLESVCDEEANWASQIDHARVLLESAWYEEGGSRAVISGYIQAEMGRAECLAGNIEAAEKLLKQAKENFTAAGLGEKVAQIEDALGCITRLRQ